MRAQIALRGPTRHNSARTKTPGRFARDDNVGETRGGARQRMGRKWCLVAAAVALKAAASRRTPKSRQLEEEE